MADYSGSDSSGGAGIEADLKTFTAHRCHGMTCITALTAQNTVCVDRVYPVTDQTFIEAGMDAVWTDVGVDAVKTGMLAGPATVGTVARKLKEYDIKKVVVDPVMVATSGATLAGKGVVQMYVEKLMPLAMVITPNIGEAEQLLEAVTGCAMKIGSVEDMKKAAIRLQSEIGCQSVLVKGGHLGLDHNLAASSIPARVVDVLYDGTNITLFEAAFIESTSTHGTGCTLSAAIAANLALSPDRPLKEIVGKSIDYVRKGIETAFKVGSGHGPLNHMHSILSPARRFETGKFLAYLIDHPKIKDLWHQYTAHPFLLQLAQGTLPLSSFLAFLKQDYLFLNHYARCQGLAAYKAADMTSIARVGSIITGIAQEQTALISYCAELNVSKKDLDTGSESLVTRAYTRFLLDTGARLDFLSVQVALAPCLLGYVAAVKKTMARPDTVHGADKNRYYSWMAGYSDPEVIKACEVAREMIEAAAEKEDLAETASEEKLEKLVEVFRTGVEMECAFWGEALKH